MKRRWFGPRLGSGRGISALLGGVVVHAWQGWAALTLLLAGLTAVIFVPGLSTTGEWVARAGAVLVFLLVVAATYGPDER